MKCKLVEYLEQNGFDVINVGSDSQEIVRYPYYASIVAGPISQGKAERGILICSTGIGMAIIANKYPGVRAGLCSSTYQARMTRAHNNANILCVGGRTVGLFEAIDILETWLKTPYEGGRHDVSLGLIESAEKVNFGTSIWLPQIPDIQ